MQEAFIIHPFPLLTDGKAENGGSGGDSISPPAFSCSAVAQGSCEINGIWEQFLRGWGFWVEAAQTQPFYQLQVLAQRSHERKRYLDRRQAGLCRSGFSSFVCQRTNVPLSTLNRAATKLEATRDFLSPQLVMRTSRQEGELQRGRKAKPGTFNIFVLSVPFPPFLRINSFNNLAKRKRETGKSFPTQCHKMIIVY